MIRIPEWQKPLYEASIGVATLLDEIDDRLDGYDDHEELYKEMYQQEAVGLFTTATPMEFI